MNQRISSLSIVTWLLVIGCVFGQSAPPQLRVDLNSNQTLLGLPIHWSSSQGVLLEPTGRIHLFDMQEVASHQLTNTPFLPQSLITARVDLQNELGSNYQVIVHDSYVIAAPNGQVAQWRDRFQALSAGYHRYFEVRGWPVRQSDFPMIVIVFSTRSEFLRYCAQTEGQPPGASVVGCYFPSSNRCVLYNIESQSEETEATIVHEAVHQLAYNTGVHERLFSNPLWIVEGFATMFEQSSVYDLRAVRSTIQSRMHAGKVAELQPLLHDLPLLESKIGKLIESDRLFRSNPQEAYALAWAMTFYLAERMPNEFERYLEKQRSRRFGNYSAGERVSDFRKTFDLAPASLATQLQRLLQGS